MVRISWFGTLVLFSLMRRCNSGVGQPHHAAGLTGFVFGSVMCSVRECIVILVPYAVLRVLVLFMCRVCDLNLISGAHG